MQAAHYENIGPLVLAGTPPTLPERQKAVASWPQLYAHCESRLQGLKVWRYSRWRRAAMLAEFILPYRYHWWITPNMMNRGDPHNASIIDNTGTVAMQICAAGLSDGLMSPSRPWFRFAPAIQNFEADAAAKVWMDDTAERVYAVLAGSNFYTEASQMFRDVATFACSPMIIYEDHEDVIRAYLPCMGEYYLGAGARLSVDVLYREYTYTVSQVVEWFGLEACPEDVRGLWQTGGASLEREFVVAHAIEPNFALSSRQGGRLNVLPAHFAYREVYWLRGHPGAAPLSLRGFTEKPFMVTRWAKRSNDPYGFGPGDDALGDIRQLQLETREKGRVIQAISKPPMGANPELEHKPSSIIPGEITYVNTANGQKGFWPLIEPNPQAIPALTSDIAEIQKRIRDGAFRNDIFLIISQMEGVQPRNELELSQRMGEKIQQLGPVIELFESDFASQSIQRVVSIMYRRNLLRPPPPSLRGVPITIEYTSMMKLAQNATQTAAIERTLGVFAKLGEGALAAGLPNPLRVINLDATARIYADRVGFPAVALYTRDEVDAHDQQKSQQAQAQQAMQATLPAVQAAEGLSRIPVGGGMSAVGALLGTGAPPGGGA